MKIVDHWLDPVARVLTPNLQEGGLEPRYILLHYSAGSYAGGVAWMTNKASRVSAHLMIGRGGEVTQMASFQDRCWHAGVSEWNGLTGLNAFSIGIELANLGALTPQQLHQEKDNAVEIEGTWWHRYTAAQLAKCAEVCLLLVREYGCEDVIGHSDVSPGRKVDPGPAFPHDALADWVIAQARTL